MAIYHFNTTDGGRDEDREGTPFDTDGAACVAAVRYAGDVMSDDPDMVMSGRHFTVDVTDDAGRMLFQVITRVQRPDGVPVTSDEGPA